MWIEAGVLKESDKNKKEVSEKQKLQVEKWISTVKEIKNKEKTETKEEKENIESEMDNILWLVEKWIISKNTAKNIIDWNKIDEDIVKEIFEKLDEIEDIKDIDKYIPQELRITKEDYSKALTDDIFRVQTITKIDSALTLLANKINPDSAMWLNLFSGFLTVLDKNLILVQENTIDVKYSLKEVDEKKFGKKEDKRSFLQKIINFIKEIFN